MSESPCPKSPGRVVRVRVLGAVRLVGRHYDVIAAVTVEISDRRLVDRLGDHLVRSRLIGIHQGDGKAVQRRTRRRRRRRGGRQARARRSRRACPGPPNLATAGAGEEAALGMDQRLTLQRRAAEGQVGRDREAGSQGAVRLPDVDVGPRRGDHLGLTIVVEIGDRRRPGAARAAAWPESAEKPGAMSWPFALRSFIVWTGQPASSDPSGS